MSFKAVASLTTVESKLFRAVAPGLGPPFSCNICFHYKTYFPSCFTLITMWEECFSFLYVIIQYNSNTDVVQLILVSFNIFICLHKTFSFEIHEHFLS